MQLNDKVRRADVSSLEIVRYPDPRLKQVCTPVDDPTDPAVAALIEKMFALMFAGRGVGLAAPQVGISVRLFVASPSFQQDERLVFINPGIISAEGTQDGDEGCLSFPSISCRIKRSRVVTVRAVGLDGEPFEQTYEDLAARICQHEIDHLDGWLLVDRMSTIAKLANRGALKHLKEQFAAS